jgi:PEP-CTERM motif-containing protein
VLLASTYVSNADPLTGFWRFHGITPITLTAGNTYVVGSQGGEGYTWFTIGMTVDPGITFLQDAWIYLGNGSNNPLVFPNTTDGFGQGVGGGFFGGNIMIGSVPEPSTLMLAGPALLALAGLARRKMNL